MSDWTEYRAAAEEAARRGAAVLAEWRGRFNVRHKGRADLVSEADVGAQRAVKSYLLGLYPGHAFLGEEEGEDKGRPGADAPPTWIVDPLDGTTNYVHDFPLYCVSIGLMVAGELVVGVVYEPVRGEMFSAATGRGATLNGVTIRVSGAESLEESLLATGFPPDVRGAERSLEWWRYFSLHAQSLRRTGSTAINLAYLAAGRFDGYYAFDNHVWDVAGGVVLVREAGGIVTNADGRGYDAFAADAVAGNAAVHRALTAALAAGVGG